MEFKDYYASLGVARDAPAEAVKKAYRKLARKYHPDVSKEPQAEQRMKEVNEAYAVLSDPEKRAAYDQLGKDYRPGQDFRPPPDWDANMEFSEREFSGAEAAQFSDFFAEIFGRHAARGSAFHSKPNDHHARVLLDLEDAFTGPERQLSLRVPKVDAEGRARLETRTLNVKIPRGIHAGQIIRLAGQGSAMNGEKPGDLLLEVAFRPHARLQPHGRDLHLTLPVAPWEAALGAVVPVRPARRHAQRAHPRGRASRAGSCACAARGFRPIRRATSTSTSASSPRPPSRRRRKSCTKRCRRKPTSTRARTGGENLATGVHLCPMKKSSKAPASRSSSSAPRPRSIATGWSGTSKRA